MISQITGTGYAEFLYLMEYIIRSKRYEYKPDPIKASFEFDPKSGSFAIRCADEPSVVSVMAKHRKEGRA